jgi:DNA-binding NarL/FixJ family response regulator
MIRVVIAEDYTPLATALMSLLHQHDQIRVVGFAHSGAEVLDHTVAKNADVVVMDMRLPGMDGVEATRRVTRERPDVKVIATTGVDDPECVARVMDAGATRFIPKDELAHEIVDAILEVAGDRNGARR